MLGMSFGGAAEIDYSATQERHGIAGAASGLHLLGDGDIAIVGGIGLRPPHQTLDLDSIEDGCSASGGGLHVKRHADLRQIESN